MRSTALKTNSDQLNALANVNPATGEKRREKEKKTKRKGLKGKKSTRRKEIRRECIRIKYVSKEINNRHVNNLTISDYIDQRMCNTFGDNFTYLDEEGGTAKGMGSYIV